MTDFPLLGFDESSGQWFPMNHPFTAPREEDLPFLESEPGRVRARAYDVVVNGWELGSGSIRIHRADLQERVFRRLGIPEAEGKERFGFLLDALRFGAPPHGGIALGLDRICAIASGASSLREVIAFPKTTSGTCLMTRAPAGVPAAAAPTSSASASAGPRPAVSPGAPDSSFCAPAGLPRPTRRSGLLRDSWRRPGEGSSPLGPLRSGLVPGGDASADAVRRALDGRLLADIPIDDREEAKTLESVGGIADRALAAGLRRDDAVVAVGGGVVSDVAGFAAAVLLRGVAWNAVPTTSGAMADAAIGGKTGVDHRAGKNLLGAFHPPRVVLIDPRALATLPDRDFRSGPRRGLQGGLDRRRGPRRTAPPRRLPRILAREEAALLDLIGRGRPRQGRDRLLRSAGRRTGGACSTSGTRWATRSRLPAATGTSKHGEAVAWGIAAALEISRRRCGLSDATLTPFAPCSRAWVPFRSPCRDPAVLVPVSRARQESHGARHRRRSPRSESAVRASRSRFRRRNGCRGGYNVASREHAPRAVSDPPLCAPYERPGRGVPGCRCSSPTSS